MLLVNFKPPLSRQWALCMISFQGISDESVVTFCKGTVCPLEMWKGNWKEHWMQCLISFVRQRCQLWRKKLR